MALKRLPLMETRAYSFKELKKIISDNRIIESAFLQAALDCRKYEIDLLCDGDTERAWFYSNTSKWTDLNIIAFPPAKVRSK